MPASVRIQSDPFDINEEIARLAGSRNNIGAVVTFTGYVRDEEGRLSALELEHYPGMAEEEISRVAEQAIERWQLIGATAIHRYGKLAPGDQIVLVVTAAGHRHAAFEAGEFIMDFLKTRAPFWKKEHLAAGGTGDWVSAKETDDQATERWSR